MNQAIDMDENSIECSDFRYGKLYHYKNDQFIGSSIKYYGEYCDAEIKIISSLLPNNAVIYDVGANIGSHTVSFSNLFPNGSVISFEPNPKNFQILIKNIEVNQCRNVRAYPVAVMSQSGKTTIEEFNESELGNFGVIRAGSGSLACPALALDDLSEPDPAVIKIDVEGFETGVLQGAKSMIERSRPMIFYEAQETETLTGCYDFLHERDYALYWFIVRNYNPNNFNKNATNIFGNSGVANVIAIPQERTDHPGYLAPVSGRHERPQDILERSYSSNFPYRVVF